MKIAIIGATSFIGRKLLTQLYRRNMEIIAVIRDRQTNVRFLDKFPNIKIVECDLADYADLGNLVGRIDCAVYLTWNGTRGDMRTDYTRQRYSFEQSMCAVKSLVEAGCRKIITAGSQAEYGIWLNNRKLTEEDEEHPNTAYGQFKLSFYKEAKIFCEEHNVKIIEPRFFSLYGPDDFAGTMIISILKKMLNNVPCDLTLCKQKWDFLYIDDAIEGIIKLIESEAAYGVYNFGSGESFPLKEYIEEMYRITGSKSKLNYGTIPYPETGIVQTDPCVDKLKSIGWEPRVKFREGIKLVIDKLHMEQS